MKQVSVAALRQRFAADAEFAVIDPPEEGIFGRAHLLAASNLPISRLELLIERAVPRRDSEIILTDGGEGTAEWAGARLQSLGWRRADISGSVEPWRDRSC